MNHEARALLRDARCAVREGGVGDNASRVSEEVPQKLPSRKPDMLHHAHLLKRFASAGARLPWDDFGWDGITAVIQVSWSVQAMDGGVLLSRLLHTSPAFFLTYNPNRCRCGLGDGRVGNRVAKARAEQPGSGSGGRESEGGGRGIAAGRDGDGSGHAQVCA